MRRKVTKAGATVNAVAGSHVVMLGMDLATVQRRRCLGFAIQREDHTEGEVYWMRGMKTFPSTDPGLSPGGNISSREHPFQSFQWSDYSAKPEHDYTYSVIPLYGTPSALAEGTVVAVRVKTEPGMGADHSVCFNRGAISSQEYVRKFENKAPDKVGNDSAYIWLSRGLLEMVIGFINRAEGAKYGLFAAIYEFQWPAVLEAIKTAANSGATVKVVFDDIPGASGPGPRNEEAIGTAKIKKLCKGRSRGQIMHNKFIVLTKNDRAIAVLIGSTNMTENGIFGHSNLAHVIESEEVASAYLAYWQELSGDPETTELKDWTGTENPAPPASWTKETTEVFSPRRGLSALDWYADIANSATQALFMTFPFGMHEKFKAVYDQPDSILRFALMEKEGNGKGLAQGRIDIARIRRRVNVVVAVGNNITLNAFDRWLKARATIRSGVHVRYVHTKYMLVDPLSDTPIVVTGSGNFSKASVDSNDENMVVIRGNARVADIYLGEFMRLYSHYAFREAAKIALEKGEDLAEWHPSSLIEDDSWQRDYYTAGHQRFLRRQYFAGT